MAGFQEDAECLNSGCVQRRSEILRQEETPSREPVAFHLCEVCVKTGVAFTSFQLLLVLLGIYFHVKTG